MPRKSRGSASNRPENSERPTEHRALVLTLLPVLAAFWLLMSGHYTPLLLTLGALSVVLSIWVVFRMEVADGEGLPLRLVPRLPRYLPWLAGQIMLSGFTVLRLVWSPRRAPEPAIGTTPAGDLSDVAKVVYANSITLTPGTLSLAVHDDDIEVHALEGESIGELQAGGMLDRVRRLERR